METKFDIATEIAECPPEVLLCLPGYSPVEIGMRVFRVHLDGSIEIGDRAFDIAFPGFYDSPVVVDLNQIWIQLDRAIKISNGFFEIFALPFGYPLFGEIFCTALRES